MDGEKRLERARADRLDGDEKERPMLIYNACHSVIDFVTPSDAFNRVCQFRDCHRMKSPKRGRPPIGRKAMTDAERQARRRQKLRKAAEATARMMAESKLRRAYQPPYGYAQAKQRLQAQGHRFVRARREFGFEEGTFIDGAYMDSHEVIILAELPPAEQEQLLAKRRLSEKDAACMSVSAYMRELEVSFEELSRYVERCRREG
jgi:hypothetical protein